MPWRFGRTVNFTVLVADSCLVTPLCQPLGGAGGGPRVERYDRPRGNLERHGVHFLTAYVAGV